jgi:hypothetical protein
MPRSIQKSLDLVPFELILFGASDTPTWLDFSAFEYHFQLSALAP